MKKLPLAVCTVLCILLCGCSFQINNTANKDILNALSISGGNDSVQELAGSIENIELNNSNDELTVRLAQTLGDNKILYVFYEITFSAEWADVFAEAANDLSNFRLDVLCIPQNDMQASTASGLPFTKTSVVACDTVERKISCVSVFAYHESAKDDAIMTFTLNSLSVEWADGSERQAAQDEPLEISWTEHNNIEWKQSAVSESICELSSLAVSASIVTEKPLDNTPQITMTLDNGSTVTAFGATYCSSQSAKEGYITEFVVFPQEGILFKISDIESISIGEVQFIF